MESRSSRLKRIRSLKRIALALAVAGIAAPTAQAYYPAEGVGASAAPPSSYAGSALVSGEDKVGLREIGPTAVVSAPAETVRFDWRDAGIGAAGGLGLALLAASGLITVRRVRRGGLATA